MLAGMLSRRSHGGKSRRISAQTVAYYAPESEEWQILGGCNRDLGV